MTGREIMVRVLDIMVMVAIISLSLILGFGLKYTWWATGSFSGCAVHSLGPGTHHLGASDMTQREVEIVVGMVLVFIVIMLLLSAWPAAPVGELLGVWVIAAMSLAPVAHLDSGRRMTAPRIGIRCPSRRLPRLNRRCHNHHQTRSHGRPPHRGRCAGERADR